MGLRLEMTVDYNGFRPHSSLDNLTPAQFREINITEARNL